MDTIATLVKNLGVNDLSAIQKKISELVDLVKQELSKQGTSQAGANGTPFLLIATGGDAKTAAPKGTQANDKDKVIGYDDSIAEYKDLTNKAAFNKFTVATALMKSVYSDLDGMFEKFIRQTATAGEVFKSFANTVIDSLIKMAAQAAAAGITKGLASLFNIGGNKDMTSTPQLSNELKGFLAGTPVDFLNGSDTMGFTFNNSNWKGSSPDRFFADGGIVTRPTLGMIGEAGYPEAVIPLTPSGVKNAGLSGAGSIPGIRLNIINNTSSEITADNTGVMADADGYIIDVVLNAAANNKKGFNRNLKTALGVG